VWAAARRELPDRGTSFPDRREAIAMGLLDRFFGRRRADHDRYRDAGYWQAAPQHGGYRAPPPPPQGGAPTDQQAIERYRYLLRTAPPDQIEEAHAEAFAQLTPQQRQEVLVQLAAAVPSSERPRSDDPRSLARAATRAEVRQPGTLERAFGGGPGYGGGYGPGYGRGYGGGGFGSTVGASLLGTIGGLVIGTAVADALFDTGLGDGGLFGGGDEEAYAQGAEGAQGDDGDYGGDPGGDLAGGADPGGDVGGGDFGGDFGGGDF
jgi:hypothetical protein